MSRYAVFDIETTGLSAAHHHRILEIGVTLVDDAGSVVYEWETLVNPERDVGATDIHGITAADVYNAPTFREIAGEVESLLRGRVPVAHNLSFDAPFLAFEFQRLGYTVPLAPSSGLCTMRLASRYLPSGQRTLESCCECIGCRMETAHAALDDARAAASLLGYYISVDADFLASWAPVIDAAQMSSWPEIPAGSVACVSRRNPAPSRTEHFLSRLVSHADTRPLAQEADGYLELLDRSLLDRNLSYHEQDELVVVAEAMGLSRKEVIALHRSYLAALCGKALEDRVVTEAEQADLEQVARLLGLTSDDVQQGLEGPASDDATFKPGGFSLEPGDAIVFTGDAPGLDREVLQAEARSLGLRPTGSVSGKTKLLVAADPDSLSGKARKARDLGTAIVGYNTYLEMAKALRERSL